MICDYGCGTEAYFQLKNGKWCCSSRTNKCPEIRRKNSLGLKKAYEEGKKDVSHFDNKRGWAKGKTAYSDSRIVAGLKYNPKTLFSKGTNPKTAKKVIIAEGLLEYKCSECEIFEWNGKPLTLELDHIDGVRDNNELSNLRLLCPNCHSQTPNYRGRRSGQQKVYDTDIVSAVKSSGNINQVLVKLGLSTNGRNRRRIEKVIDKYNLSF